MCNNNYSIIISLSKRKINFPGHKCQNISALYRILFSSVIVRRTKAVFLNFNQKNLSENRYRLQNTG